MHMMLFNVLYFYRTECANAYMKRNISNLHSHIPHFFQKFFCKMQPCRRCGYRTFFFAVNGLIPVLILAVIISLDIWRKWHLSQFLQTFHKNTLIPELHNPRSVFTVIFYGSLEQFLFGK